MEEVTLNEVELGHVGLFRAALSEETKALRKNAVLNVRHEVMSIRLKQLVEVVEAKRLFAAQNLLFMQWFTATSSCRIDAALEVSETMNRYEVRNEKKLNIAEEIGFLIFVSIQEQKFKGIHTKGGIFEQVRRSAIVEGVHGAKDKDVLRQYWRSYRGVVHLGMAMKYREENPDQNFNVLELAELYRTTLSENCPGRTSKPYVDPAEQISFVYLSKTSGPRFENRGLPYGVS